MESYYVANTSSTSTTAHFNFWMTVPDTQPMTVFQTMWPGLPLTLPYEVTVPRPPYIANVSDYSGVVVPSRVIPHFYNTIEKPSPRSHSFTQLPLSSSTEEGRKFILNRSVFDLVDAHQYLALTDPKLLGWYLCLSPEDRRIIQDEGGFHQFLQRHPALALSNHHVYVIHMSHSYPDMEMLPNNVNETVTLLGCSGDGLQKHPQEEICHTEQALHQQDSFQIAISSPITEDPNHQNAHKQNEERPSWQMDCSSSSAAVCKDQAALASFSVDMDLERHRAGGETELRSQITMTRNQSANLTSAEVGPVQSEWPTVTKESPSVGTVDDDEVSSSFEDQSDKFCSIMEDDKSILVCLASEDVKAHTSEAHSGPVIPNSEALAASSETLKSVMKMKTAEMYTSPMPCITTCDVMVGTELALCKSAFTQTEDPGRSDKHIITEVHMADLDYIAEEFIKLKMSKEELREQKEKIKSLDCKLRKECDCIERAQRSELCLLALQYSMCRQHCWRLYFTSAEGGQFSLLPKNPPANIVSVLQKLESDYNQMRAKILAGVSLEQLKPLSVDSEKITTGGSYIPAQMIGAVLGNVPSWSSHEPHNPSGQENGSPDNESRNSPKYSQREEQIKNNNKVRRAAILVPQSRDTIHNANKQGEEQTPATCKELNTSEAWYDAEEDLEPAGPALAAETGQDPTVIMKDKTTESASEEAKSSALCVSNLPSNVTESDVMLWFEKYNASEVTFSALKNDLRVAIVAISEPQSAEAAVRELNGCSMQGHTLYVDHINRAIGGSHSQASASVSWAESSEDVTKPQTSKTESSSTEREEKVVCIFPSAKGTCVPQHYGTMGSFDTLMAELTQRHPDVGRQKIVDALMELKSKHKGVLGGLSLRSIREMTSELLTRPTRGSQL